MNNGLTAPFVLSFATNASDDIFAGTHFGNGIFRSTDDVDSWNEKDNGDSWTPLNTGITNATFLSLAINASGYIFAGGDPLGGLAGVFRSTDNGGTWQPFNNGSLQGTVSTR